MHELGHPVGARPRSASGRWTGPAGLIVGLAGLILFKDWAAPTYLRTMALMLVVAGTMVAVEGLVSRSNSTGLMGKPAAPVTNWRRVIQKLFGLVATLGAVGTLYWLFPLYADPYYQPFRDAAVLALPVILLAAPFYFAYVDARQTDPEDAYVEVARLVSGVAPKNWNVLLVHCRGWLVKAFFLPLMFVFLSSDLSKVWAISSLPRFDSFQTIYSHAYDLLFLIDVLIGAVGYTMTLRLLGTEIRSAEPTVWGWAVCLVCYPPFWNITQQYLSYDQDGKYWGDFFWDTPVLYTIWGSAILVLVCIYVWSTLSFGVRFSNLTHRGVITHGPYRWMKHPAYVSKNLTWWMISMPFITGSGDWSLAVRSSVLLAGVNAIYLLRAISEERHLGADPVYRQYQAFIAEHGLIAIVRRMMTRRQAILLTPEAQADK